MNGTRAARIIGKPTLSSQVWAEMPEGAACHWLLSATGLPFLECVDGHWGPSGGCPLPS